MAAVQITMCLYSKFYFVRQQVYQQPAKDSPALLKPPRCSCHRRGTLKRAWQQAMPQSVKAGNKIISLATKRVMCKRQYFIYIYTTNY